MIIIGLTVLVFIMAFMMMNKAEGYDMGYPYQWPYGFAPLPDGTLFSDMTDIQYKQALQNASCIESARQYCSDSAKVGAQSYMTNDSNIPVDLGNVVNTCGPQFPVKQFCSNNDPMYGLSPSDFIRGGTHLNKPASLN